MVSDKVARSNRRRRKAGEVQNKDNFTILPPLSVGDLLLRYFLSDGAGGPDRREDRGPDG